MTNETNPIDLIRNHNPVPDAHQLPDGPYSASSEALFEEIIGMKRSTPTTRRRHGRRIGLIAASIAVVAVTSAAAVVVLSEGNLEEPAFSGETWQLTVGEGANDSAGTVHKVCHSFERPGNATEANGLGTSGCDVVSRTDTWDSMFVEVVPAVDTPDGVVIFIDLTTEPVETVSLTFGDDMRINVAPFRMPESGKQFAAVEIPDGHDAVEVELLDADGSVMESRTVTGISTEN